MKTTDNEKSSIFAIFSLLSGATFGAWQQNAFAGVFVVFLLMVVMTLVFEHADRS